MNVILVRYGEIHLKGQNRPLFEKLLLRAIKNSVEGLAQKVVKTQGRYYVEQYDINDQDEIIERLKCVFGVHSISIAKKVDKELDKIIEASIELVNDEAKKYKNPKFKVNARRSDKTFPLNSMELAPLIGGKILESNSEISVAVKDYDFALGVEIREVAYIYTGEIMGQGGMPIGSSSKAALLLSGGIDSPVAGHMIMKRGVRIECVHFHSFPFTSERALNKVKDLTKIMAKYCGAIRLHVVAFTEIQKKIYEICPDRETTVIMRRAMMQIAEGIAKKYECRALITGEAIGQVASQTLQALECTNEAVDMPVFRPLIGFDKNEILERSRNIGTYETSILPYEDCCTIFTPKHPVTAPKVERIKESQGLIENWQELIDQAIDSAESEFFKYNMQ